MTLSDRDKSQCLGEYFRSSGGRGSRQKLALYLVTAGRIGVSAYCNIPEIQSRLSYDSTFKLPPASAELCAEDTDVSSSSAELCPLPLQSSVQRTQMCPLPLRSSVQRTQMPHIFVVTDPLMGGAVNVSLCINKMLIGQ
ncbi:hypothetical protein STEG23_028475 [Scotinomys teguina]